MILTIVHKNAPAPLVDAKIKALAHAAARWEKNLAGEVELTIVGKTSIKDLNRRYRGHDRPTDVLSFAWKEDRRFKPKNMLGQLYICPAQIKIQAKRFKVSFVEEFSRSFVHGLLHLAGHDHLTPQPAKKMFALQEKILAQAR